LIDPLGRGTMAGHPTTPIFPGSALGMKVTKGDNKTLEMIIMIILLLIIIITIIIMNDE